MPISSLLFYTKNSQMTILIAAMEKSCSNYIHAVSSAGFIPITLDSWFKPELHYDYAALSSMKYDLLLLPGGGDIDPGHYNQVLTESNVPEQTLDLIQFLLLQDAINRQIPVLGICKGMQLINIFFGGDLYQDFPTSNLHRYIDQDQNHLIYTDKTIDSDLSNTDLFLLLCSIKTVNSAHHQCLNKLGTDLLCIQYSQDDIPETILHNKLPIIGFQWHPERLSTFTPNMFRRLVLDLY